MFVIYIKCFIVKFDILSLVGELDRNRFNY